MTKASDRNRDRTLVFDCPLCGGSPAVTGEHDVYVHAGVIHHCAVCGGEVVFQVLTVERYLEAVNGAVDCCCLADQCEHEFSTLMDIDIGGSR